MNGYLLDTSICVFLLIGSAAKAKDLVMVTHNRKHFEHIKGISIEDWV